MATICQICSAEQPKYRCPACGAQSCSLTCSQKHKPSCEPRPSNSVADKSSANNNMNADSVQNTGARGAAMRDLSTLGSSTELQQLLTKYPRLRTQLGDIYKTTLEEEWGDSVSPAHGRGRHRSRGRGRGGHAGARGNESRGQWTAEKGFNRGLGMVRKLRASCEEGAGGIDAEGFSKFVDLVTEDQHLHGQS